MFPIQMTNQISPLGRSEPAMITFELRLLIVGPLVSRQRVLQEESLLALIAEILFHLLVHRSSVSLQFVLQLELLLALITDKVKLGKMDESSVVVKSRGGLKRLLALFAVITAHRRVSRFHVLLQGAFIAKRTIAYCAGKPSPCFSVLLEIILHPTSSSIGRGIVQSQLLRMFLHVVDEQRPVEHSVAHFALEDLLRVFCSQMIVQLTTRREVQHRENVQTV